MLFLKKLNGIKVIRMEDLKVHIDTDKTALKE